MHRTRVSRFAALGVAGATAVAGLGVALPSASADDAGRYSTKTPTSRGFGGAVTSVDPEASRVGLQVLKNGGNAVDAAVATAAALGVTEPYSSGLGGGGYFVYYDAKTKKVHTIDGRETAPASMPRDAFIDKSTGKPYNFTPELVTSGVSVGVPGTPATWAKALREWGTYRLAGALAPAEKLARRGFVVDKTFHQQTLDNQTRFEAYTSTPRLFLPGGTAPRTGSVFRNTALANTYRALGRKGVSWFYRGPIAREIAHNVQSPPKSSTTALPVPAGHLTRRDLAGYRALFRTPTYAKYRGYGVWGMGGSSSGGTTVGEALNIMEQFPLRRLSSTQQLHVYLEASALAFADRAKYLGDPAFVKIPRATLLSDRYAASRACSISLTTAMPKPTTAGDVRKYDPTCGGTSSTGTTARRDTENVETTNLTVTDKRGNVVEYTLTIEQTGGSGLLLPGRGFLLNNELTDFSAVYDAADPNRIQPGKRPRSSISPTLVLRDGKPVVALGSPGGSTIITTVLQMITDRIDRQLSLPQTIADPRGSQRNTAAVSAEPEFIEKYGAGLQALGHPLTPAGDKFTSASEIGAATAVAFKRHGYLVAVSEPRRRGGGSALVVRPSR
ncbi:gamma-glutamyltransferase [Nocardioides panacis]|uniref:Glutathione hydrolase proenzyme n=1 Tax=Nocardioides panacis TaxID=2849501 RepID=A0A975Y166_9ACTN|nr:gamma-glutamyltransferase [Nocardioides panacis]QWZ09202.1 gamma-glutamyltransferase [Nocardioides panacis]